MMNNLRAAAHRVMSRYGGTVKLSRQQITPPANPWDDPAVITLSEDVRFIATEARAEWVGQGVVRVDDLMGIMALPDELNPPKLNDTLTAGGRVYTILRVQPVGSDPDGVVHYEVQCR